MTSFSITQTLNTYSQNLSSQDKLGNTQIQTLMSNYNQAQTTLSGLQKSMHDANSALIGKI